MHRELPILFSGPMVRAILDGTKTQTRRVVEPRRICGAKLPYGEAPRLWVKETWKAHLCAGQSSEAIHYRADGEHCPNDGEIIRKWRPASHMPRWASRITLEVTEIRMQRLHDIAHYDCEAEGLRHIGRATWTCPGTEELFREGYLGYKWLWDSTQPNKDYAWDSNPWVWAITFRRVL